MNGAAASKVPASRLTPPVWMDRPMVAKASRKPASPNASRGRAATSAQLLLPRCSTSRPACPDHRVFSTAKSSASSKGS
jgi:hypothetical protein